MGPAPGNTVSQNCANDLMALLCHMVLVSLFKVWRSREVVENDGIADHALDHAVSRKPDTVLLVICLLYGGCISSRLIRAAVS